MRVRLALVAACLLAAALPATVAASPATPPGCPATTVTVTGPNGVPATDDYQTNASATTFEVRSTRFPVQSHTSQDIQTWLNKTSGTGGDCWVGGIMAGSNLSMTWSQLKACCNAWFWAASKSATWTGVVGNDPDEDAFHLLGVTPAYTILDSQISNVRDECFSTAHDNLTVDNTYCSGWTIISWRNTGGGAGLPFHVSLSGDVFWLKAQLEGAETACPAGGKYGHGLMWKMDSFHGTAADITATNTVWRVDTNETNRACLAWPAGSYSGDTIVYTGPGTYKGPVPAGVKVTSSIAVWYAAVDSWCAGHWSMNYASQTACDAALDN